MSVDENRRSTSETRARLPSDTITARLRVRDLRRLDGTRLLLAAIAIVGVTLLLVLLFQGRSGTEKSVVGNRDRHEAESADRTPAPPCTAAGSELRDCAGTPAPAPVVSASLPEPIVRSMLPAEPMVTPLVDEKGSGSRPRAKRERARGPSARELGRGDPARR